MGKLIAASRANTAEALETLKAIRKVQTAAEPVWRTSGSHREIHITNTSGPATPNFSKTTKSRRG